MRFMLHENNGYKNTPSSPQLSIPAPLSFSYLFHHFLSWSLCISTVLMIHVLIPLCQGPRAASITLCPCLLLALAALTLHPLSLIKKRKKKKLLLSSATQTLSQYLGPDLKSFFFQWKITLIHTLPSISFSFSKSLHSILSDRIYWGNWTQTHVCYIICIMTATNNNTVNLRRVLSNWLIV